MRSLKFSDEAVLADWYTMFYDLPLGRLGTSSWLIVDVWAMTVDGGSNEG